jgi:hypothetical protein
MVYVPQCSLSLMKLRRHLPRRIQNSLSKRRILPWKVCQRCLYIWESTSLVSNAVTTRSASNKRKISDRRCQDHRVNSHSGKNHHHHFHPLFQPRHRFIALQINSGTFALVMPQLPRFTNFRTSNRPTSRIPESSGFDQNKPTNRSFHLQAKSLTNSNESPQTSADRSQHQ